MQALNSSTAARLRKTFHYPTDDSSTDAPAEVLDEEEQETLIQTLSSENASGNEQFRTLLLAVPALSAIPFLISIILFKRPSSPSFLVSLLGLSSLCSTAILLHRLPPTETGIPALDAWAPSPDRDKSRSQLLPGGTSSDHYVEPSPTSRQPRRGRRSSSFSLRSRVGQQGEYHSYAQARHRSPLETHLPYLNAGLCAVLLLMGFLSHTSSSAEDGPSPGGRLLAGLPAVVYAVVIVAKVLMASVDPERELSGLRYECKGA